MSAVLALKPAAPMFWPRECIVSHNGHVVLLTKRQAQLLGRFIQSRGRIITTDNLATFLDPGVRCNDASALARTLLCAIRVKLGAAGIALRIETRQQIGRVYYGDVVMAPPGDEFVFPDDGGAAP